MLTRCENPRASKYEFYGARGVQVCDRWKLFKNFLADMGERPSLKHTLDRFPNKDGNYEPDNCRWATSAEQNKNRRSSRSVLRSDGITFPSMKDAADSVGGNHKSIWDACNRRQVHRGYHWSYA